MHSCVELLLPDFSGLKLISHIVFNKLPAILKGELVHEIGSNYPSLKELFDNYHDSLKTIIRTSLKNKFFIKKAKLYHKGTMIIRSFSALQNFTTQSSASHPRKHCKFCNASRHVMYRCDKYNSHEVRRQRCLEMGLCVLCSSPFHKKHNVLAKIMG